MVEETIKTKTECGLVYYKKYDEQWKLAGRDGHPLTKRYLELMRGKDVCVCETCETLEDLKSGRID